MFSKYFVSIVVIFFLLSFSFVANSGVIFSDTFDDNSNGWTENSNWDVTGGVYQFTSNTEFFEQNKSYISFGDVSAADLNSGSFTFSYDVKFDSPWVGFLLGGAWEDSLGNQNWSSTSKEYSNSVFRDITQGTPLNSLSGTDGFGATSLSFNFGQWYHFDVKINSGEINYFLDGNNIASQVTGNVDLYSMDYIGFSSWRANGSFDNLTISSTSVPEPTTLAIFALGMFGLASRRFKKQS